MTKEEMMNLKEGQFVNHKNYGLCKVLERTLSIGVDLEILTPGCECLGHFKKILETRPSLINVAKRITKGEFDKAFENAVKRTKAHRAKWEIDMMRNSEWM